MQIAEKWRLILVLFTIWALNYGERTVISSVSLSLGPTSDY
jgi:hypothetical protein